MQLQNVCFVLRCVHYHHGANKCCIDPYFVNYEKQTAIQPLTPIYSVFLSHIVTVVEYKLL